jgi:nitroimidazol reductase NimA-like FMN-containing flavoprotein (pyridoxamine 5'-phosphate oxidase superfamily)
MTNANGVPTTSEPDTRTGLLELSPAECWELLAASTVGRLAVAVGSTPDIFPVNYFVRGSDIVIHTEAGTKLAAATMMAAAAFEIDHFDQETRSGWSVVVKGPGREPVHLAELMALEELADAPWVDAKKTRWIVITPDTVTGRRVP